MVIAQISNTFLSPYSIVPRTLHTIVWSLHSFYTSMWVEPTVKLPCSRRGNHAMYIASVTPYINLTFCHKLFLCVLTFFYSSYLYPKNYRKMKSKRISICIHVRKTNCTNCKNVLSILMANKIT